ncbi:hypothetical protein KUTeg_023129 [Tegillarca granosa]|uniref:Tetraspanin n=1 Tax=Tegillarca granosa TaxID=220873 RepID=A0ABQ9E4D0_TEGGR|nr:hypothetical protein KUTeg_023129 [Tegillarca granosa]
MSPFQLSGLALLVVGIIIKADDKLVDLQKLVDFDSNAGVLSTTAYILIGFGLFVLVVGALGCFGAIKQQKVLLAMYIFFLIIIFLGEFSSGILAAVFKGKTELHALALLSL